MSFETFDPRFGTYVPFNVPPKKLAGGFDWAEGRPKGGAVFQVINRVVLTGSGSTATAICGPRLATGCIVWHRTVPCWARSGCRRSC